MAAKMLCLMLVIEIVLLLECFCWFSTVGSSSIVEPSSYQAQFLYASKTAYKHSASLFPEFSSRTGIVETREDLNDDVAEAVDTDRVSYNNNDNNNDDTWSEKRLVPDTCLPKQLSLIIRHGTRFPSPGDVKRTADFLQKLKHMHLSERHTGLKSWSNYFTMENTRQLHKNGAKENVIIANQLINKFPRLFNSFISLTNFEVISSNKVRTIASAEAFLQVMSELHPLNYEDLVSSIRLRNDLTRGHDHCTSYIDSIKENKEEITAEFKAFLKGPAMEEAAKRVSLRISGDDDADLISADDLRTMWVACGFETAFGEPGHQSPWCAALTSSESELLEYAFDLKAYWMRGYGYTLNYEWGCALLVDVYQNMHDVSRNDSAPKVSLYFGHSETLLPIYSLLGLFYDERPLLASNYLLNRNRKFRLSFISPFAANIGLVLYECEKGPQSTHPNWPDNLNSLMLQINVNGHPIPFPFTKKLAISLLEFETYYYQHIHYCDFDEICGNPSNKKSFLHEEL